MAFTNVVNTLLVAALGCCTTTMAATCSVWKCPTGHWDVVDQRCKCGQPRAVRYKYVSGSFTHDEAEWKCKQLGGRLAEIHSEYDSRMFRNDVGVTHGESHIGLKMYHNEGSASTRDWSAKWLSGKWLNKSCFSGDWIYTKRDGQEPNNWKNSEDCVSIHNPVWRMQEVAQQQMLAVGEDGLNFTLRRERGTWNDLFCTKKRNAMCEIASRCLNGQQWNGGSCKTCPSGHAGTDGICEKCADGLQPNWGQTMCECPKGQHWDGCKCTTMAATCSVWKCPTGHWDVVDQRCKCGQPRAVRYKYVSGLFTQSEAESACTKLSTWNTIGRLAEIHSEYDSRMFRNDVGVTHADSYVGLKMYHNDATGDWSAKWLSGEPLNKHCVVTDWIITEKYGQEPNNANRNEDCVEIRKRSNFYSGTWNDLWCGVERRAMCEIIPLTACPNGRYWNGRWCKACPVGHAGTGGNCKMCADGLVPDPATNTTCVCPSGQSWDGCKCVACSLSGTCDIKCESGEEPNEKGTDCIPCAEGTAGTDGTCEKCKDGRKPNPSRTSCDYEYEKYCGLLSSSSIKECENCADCFQDCRNSPISRSREKLCQASCVETNGNCYKDKTCLCQRRGWKSYCKRNKCSRKCRDCNKICKKEIKNELDRLLCTFSCADSRGECDDDDNCACFPN